MIDYKAFNFESFDFIDEPQESFERRFAKIIGQIVLSRLMIQTLPVKPKANGKQGRETFLEDLTGSIGLYKSHLDAVLAFHKKRLSFRYKISKIVYYLSSALFGILFLSLPVFLITGLEGRFVAAAIVAGLQFFLLLVTVSITLSLVSALTNKYFAESLCVMIAVYVVVDLSRDDVLTDPRKRKALVTRLEDLAQATRCLAFRYRSKNETNQEWINSHFERLRQYILERARWAVAPTGSTLDDLRQDLYKLADMYVEGSYGSFSWQPQYDLPEQSLSWTTRVFRTVPSFLGIVAPLILLILLLRDRTYLNSVGEYSSTITLILIAWLLLAIDGALKLGVVAGIANLAKEIKSLK